jgi:hypothetical protein
MAKNVTLLNATMNLIKANPQLHDQGMWVDPCATTMCFAGHAAVLAGATFDKEIWANQEDWDVDPKTGQHVNPYEYDGGEDEENWPIHVAEFAMNKLGLTWEERDYLFNQSRTREQLEQAVSKFSEGYSCDRHGNFFKS